MEGVLMGDDENVAQTGHCMKCKEKREMKDTEESTMKNGGTMLRGTCTTCGGKMCKIVGKKKAE
jgi:hypothetical protein